MAVLLIEHHISDFEVWKEVFDSDPVGRKANGAKRYWVYRPVDDPHYVLYGLEFDTAQAARDFAVLPALSRARQTYGAEGIRARVFEEVDSTVL